MDSFLQVRCVAQRGALYQVDIRHVLEKRRKTVAHRMKIMKPHPEKRNVESSQQFIGYQIQINPVKYLDREA